MFDEPTASHDEEEEQGEASESTQTATRTQIEVGMPIARERAAGAPPLATRRPDFVATMPLAEPAGQKAPVSVTPSSLTPAPVSGARVATGVPSTEHDGPTIVATPRYPQSRPDQIENTVVHPGLLNARQLPEDMPPFSSPPPTAPLSASQPIPVPPAQPAASMTPRDLAVRAALAAASVQEDEKQRAAGRERLVELGTIALLGLAAVVAATASYLSTYWLEAASGSLGKAPAYGSITVVSIIVLVLGGFAAQQKKEELKLACLAMGAVMLLYALIRLVVLPFM
jgi:hypothetical protein